MIFSWLLDVSFFFFFYAFFFSILLSGILLVLSYLLILPSVTNAKISSYECGFDPFSDVREPVQIHFYLICILFIIFDLEILFCFPYLISFLYTHVIASLSFFVFLFLLTCAFVIEWKKGALTWI